MHQDISEQRMHIAQQYGYYVLQLLQILYWKYICRVENCPEIYVLENLPLKSIFGEYAPKR